MAFRIALALLCLSGCVAPNYRAAELSNLSKPYGTDPNVLDTEVTDESVEPLIYGLARARGSFTLVINSPGGSVFAGLRLIEAMREAQTYRGVRITCIVPPNAYAASMAAAVLQSCDGRYMSRQGASLLFHTVSLTGVFEGNQWDAERLARMLRSMNKRLNILCSARMTISLSEYESRVHDTDWWLGADEALAVGAIDGII